MEKENKMITKLNKLKEKIMKGTTTETDVDTINEVISYIKQLEAVLDKTVQIPTQEEFCMEPGTVNVSINSAVIHIYRRESDNPPSKLLKNF